MISKGLLVGTVLAAAAGATAVASGDIASDGPLGCEVSATATNGMIALKGLARSSDPVAGEYRFRVRSTGGAGNSNISQGGGFTAGPGEDAILGTVMLMRAGMSYEATLDVTADGFTVTCTERVGAVI